MHFCEQTLAEVRLRAWPRAHDGGAPLRGGVRGDVPMRGGAAAFAARLSRPI